MGGRGPTQGLSQEEAEHPAFGGMSPLRPLQGCSQGPWMPGGGLGPHLAPHPLGDLSTPHAEWGPTWASGLGRKDPHQHR